jgi:ribosomal protein S18 acetylase RimI-like enzyme
VSKVRLREQLEFLRPVARLEGALAGFFAALVAAGDDRTFHPHPFTAAAAAERARYEGADVYCVAVAGETVLAYGMLRGWDEGYEIPSLGIAIHPEARGLGLGRAMMAYLHAEARRRGAPKIRLKVYPDNATAVSLYRSFGYGFSSQLEAGQLVAYKDLAGGT